MGLLARSDPHGGWDGVHIPTSADATAGIEKGGSLRSRPPVPVRHSRPGGRDATIIRTTTYEVADAHVRNGFSCTCTPISHVRLWIGIGRAEHRFGITAFRSKNGSLQRRPVARLVFWRDFRKDGRGSSVSGPVRHAGRLPDRYGPHGMIRPRASNASRFLASAHPGPYRDGARRSGREVRHSMLPHRRSRAPEPTSVARRAIMW